MKQIILLALGAACVVCLFAVFEVTQMLGAHPRWAFDVAIYGAVPGVLLAVFLFLASRFAVYFAAIDLVLSAIVVWYGKRAFVASSGDDALGGQMWFFGWIAVCACAVALIALLLHRAAYGRTQINAD